MAEETKVLIVGEHPMIPTGNGGMLASLLQKLNRSKYNVTLFLIDRNEVPLADNTNQLNEFPIVSASEQGDIWGKNKLLTLMSRYNFDIVLFVGIDIWRYQPIFSNIDLLVKRMNAKWMHLLPYDLPYIREDWLEWINTIPYPFVYSEFGYNILKGHVKNLRFFRPEPYMYTLFQHISQKEEIRKNMFGSVLKEGQILFGYVGTNQLRKNIGNLVKGFSLHLQNHPDSVLYMHTENCTIWDVQMLREDFKIPPKNLIIKPEKMIMDRANLRLIYNMCNCMVNPTIQEGLSWTVIESIMCGTPVIISDSTAHKDFIKDDKDLLISLEPTEQTFLNLMTRYGPRYVESEKAVNPEAIHQGMNAYIEYLHGHNVSYQLQNTAARWLSECSNINKLLKTKNETEEEIQGEFI